MTDRYESLISDLRKEIGENGARLAVVDAAISELSDKADKRLPGDFLSLLSDEASDDDGMFSLIHAAEAVEDESYVAALLSVFPAVSARAPRWASIVLMRVLNNASTQSELVRQMQAADADTKSSFRTMCAQINSVSPAFLSKTVAVTVAAR